MVVVVVVFPFFFYFISSFFFLLWIVVLCVGATFRCSFCLITMIRPSCVGNLINEWPRIQRHSAFSVSAANASLALLMNFSKWKREEKNRFVCVNVVCPFFSRLQFCLLLFTQSMCERERGYCISLASKTFYYTTNVPCIFVQCLPLADKLSAMVRRGYVCSLV